MKRNQISGTAAIANKDQVFDTSKQLDRKDFDKFCYGFLADVDLRTRKGRMMLVAYTQICDDKGGEDYMSLAERELARKLATYSAISAEIEENISKSEEVDEKDLNRYTLATKTMTNIMKQLGVKREPRNISDEAKDITEYLNRSG